jgi:hypothetical protein
MHLLSLPNNLEQMFKFTVLIVTALQIVQARNVKKQINEQKHHVKWIHFDYLLPIVLTKNIYNPVDADFKVKIRTKFEK